MNTPLIAFVGDDFTGSTDALESLARHGLQTVLFTNPPTAEQLARYPNLSAFGIAGMTRALPTDQIESALRPALDSLRASGAPIVHYKTCSTFDSSPTVGSIGRVIDIGIEVFGSPFVPVLAGAPALGRYSAFGNLFARCGADPEVYRLDRHPSMSRHPVTPMDEADLRRHLERQTSKSVGLLTVLDLELHPDELARRLENAGKTHSIVLLDILYDRHLPVIGNLLASGPNFIVGSSGVEAALCAHWEKAATIGAVVSFPAPSHVGPIAAICGSQSPVTAAQTEFALAHGFTLAKTLEQAQTSLTNRRGICIPTDGDPTTAAQLLTALLENHSLRRVLIAGGDTASHIARALKIQSVEMIAELTRGSPLCRASAPGSPADGLEITFKGGQIGPPDFFAQVERGSP